jgi:gamma-glutamyltranspeptidase / glutathione hydrolase
VGFFERPDPRLAQSADPEPAAAVTRMLGRHAIGFAACILVVAGAYATNVAIGLHVAAPASGRIAVNGLYDRVVIVRDRRDVPHIRASNDHDLYFAEGFVQGSDRLFQLDVSRRYAYGRLAEVLGAKALPYDKELRAVDVDGIARRQLRALAPHDRAALVAFSDGINAAAAIQPLPVEFRMLFYRFAQWTPKDSLAVAVVASLELADSWHDIFARDAIWRAHGRSCFNRLLPISDERYDVTTDGALVAQRIESSPSCGESRFAERPSPSAIGSNAWAAGAMHTSGRDALLANDPHLDVTIPGIWYLLDTQSPGVHAAGATVPGLPGVLLGHNERVAWASTNADMTTASVFEAGRLDRRSWQTETFHVRFARDVHIAYYRTAREFSVPDESDPSKIALVRWPVYAETRSTIATALAMDRVGSAGEALRVLAKYRGSPQNFIVGDRSGAVAYHVAGLVPDDPAWGRYVHPARDLNVNFAPLAYTQLPARSPSSTAILVSANNKPYGERYPYRLSAQFEAPYRAYRIAQLLRARERYDASYFARMQLDTFSPIDFEIARDAVRLAGTDTTQQAASQTLATLARWDGRYRPASRAAALEHALRVAVFEDGPAFYERLSQLRQARNSNSPLQREIGETLWALGAQSERPWRDAGGMRVEHLLAPMNFGFLNGAWLPGAGDEYTVHLQDGGIAQGFRAVWEVGKWNQGGIAIPSGESGEPGSGHYTDLTRDWIAGTLPPLPFGRGAVAANAENVLALEPALGATAKSASHAMVATAQHEATNAGVAILRAGGNAIDAAVAVGYALAVVDPCCGNIGGGGFMVIRMHDGRERFIDFRERAPKRATRTMYLDANGNVRPWASRRGWLAVAVPGTVAGLEAARQEFGTMSRARLIAPAIALARDGFTFESGDLLPFTGSRMEGYSGGLAFYRQPNVAAIFLPDGAFPDTGTRFRQSQLAKTLELIARDGTGAFYRGSIARAIVAASAANGGILSLEDLADYRIEEAAPLRCAFRGYDIISAPPPSSGGVTLCEILNIVAPFPLARWGWHDFRSLHYVTEAERLAFADRNAYLGDPDFVHDPVAQLLAPKYAASLRSKIDRNRATPSVAVHPGLSVTPNEGRDTTHYSIVDRWGNAVSVTYTLNDWFGSGVIAGDTGFFLNDEMDDFTSKPGTPNMYGLVQGEANAIEPGKRPLSSMAPTILTRDGKLAMVTGSPGGSRIITIVLETMLDALLYDMSAQRAVDAPRTHMQWLPDELEYEPGAFSLNTSRRLTQMGYSLKSVSQWGSAQAILVDPKTGQLEGGSDRRTPAGSAQGY